MSDKQRKPQFSFEAKPEFIEELKEVASITEIPASRIARDAIREKMDQLKQTHPNFQKQLQEFAA